MKKTCKHDNKEKTDFQQKIENLKLRTNAMTQAEDGNWNPEYGKNKAARHLRPTAFVFWVFEYFEVKVLQV